MLPRLKRFALSLTRNPSEADDLVQSACEKAISRIDQWDPGTRLDSWMFRIVQTTHIDALRSTKRRANKIENIKHHHETTVDGRQTTEAAMTLENVRRAILELPDEQRAVIMLVCVEGYSYREASDILEIPTGTLTSRLVRGRTALAKSLEVTDTREDAAAKTDTTVPVSPVENLI